MDDLISRSALLRVFESEAWDSAYLESARVVGEIKAAPAVESKPVVYAHWVEDPKNRSHIWCSNCITTTCTQHIYCPHCGATMRWR